MLFIASDVCSDGSDRGACVPEQDPTSPYPHQTTISLSFILFSCVKFNNATV